MAAFYFAGNELVVHISRLALSRILELHYKNCHLKTCHSETSFQSQKEESLRSLHPGQEWHGEASCEGQLDLFHQMSSWAAHRTLDGYSMSVILWKKRE